ncbi:MAG: DNA repair protein RecN [Clostridia bacterium]
MLVSLFIENIAVIRSASIDFNNGFTILTGETGAGKSIILDALGAILGQRTSKDIIRTGSDTASVTALFDVGDSYLDEKLEQHDIKIENSQLLLYRQLKSNGKSVCKINGVPVTVATLKEIGVELVGIHGQHDSYELLSPDIHGKYLDDYAGLGRFLSEYQDNFNKLRSIKLEIDKLSQDQSHKERRIDFLKYQIEEIEDANIQIGEKDRLLQRRELIRNSQKIASCLQSAKNIINGEDETNALVMLGNACDEIEDAAESLEELTQISEKLRDIEYSLQDVYHELSRFDTDFSPEELEEIEERIDILYKLSLKYGENEEDILKTLEDSQNELRTIELSDEKIEQLSLEFEKYKVISIKLAKDLSEKRKYFALEFSQKVKDTLQFLNMPNIEFIVALERCNLYLNGCDKIQFLISANSGEEPKPLSKTASGGELSRIMLAIKTVLSKNEHISTMIFDEIDTGISGETANKVGKKIKELSKDRQVICITHLAQIAAMADNHFLIKKEIKGGHTFTSVNELTKEKRIDELARIIGGNELTPLKRKIAKELIDNS